MPFVKGGKIKRGSTVLATKHARREKNATWNRKKRKTSEPSDSVDAPAAAVDSMDDRSVEDASDSMDDAKDEEDVSESMDDVTNCREIVRN
jgi:hypothetical protein